MLREKKLTLSDLHEFTGIRITQLSDYAYNRRRMSLTNSFKIGFALEIPVEELYDTKTIYEFIDRKKSRQKSE